MTAVAKEIAVDSSTFTIVRLFFPPISSITKNSIEVFLWAEDVICCTGFGDS